jgi:Ser/Thr protein kinase RdoA (MazF antagonist)
VSATIIDGTVRKPVRPWTPAVHSLLRRFEAVGFDGAPRALGVQDEVEVLSYVEGERSYDRSDAVVSKIGRLVRRMHDAQAGFEPPQDAQWQVLPHAVAGDEVVCHNDLLGANVVFREGAPVAFIDWELAAPGPRGVDLVAPAAYWVPLRPDADAARHRIPTDRRGERLRRLLDAYGYEQRDSFLDLVAAVWRSWREAFRLWGGVERRDRWAEAYDSGRCDYIDGNLAWLEAHRAELGKWL